MTIVRRVLAAVAVALGAFAATAGAEAQIETIDIGLNPTYQQTSAGVISTGGFFSARAFFTSSNDFAAGSLSYAGPGSPASLLNQGYSQPELGHGDSNASFSALQAAYPPGDYAFDLYGGDLPETFVSMSYEGSQWSNAPTLSDASYLGLQNLNAAHSFTVDFGPMTAGPDATGSDIIFTVTNSANDTVFSTVLNSSATSVIIPGGTLMPGMSYSFDVLFSVQISGLSEAEEVADPYSVTATQFYDSHTDGTIFTVGSAVPEASTWAMMLAGFAGVGVLARRKGVRRIAV